MSDRSSRILRKVKETPSDLGGSAIQFRDGNEYAEPADRDLVASERLNESQRAILKRRHRYRHNKNM